MVSFLVIALLLSGLSGCKAKRLKVCATVYPVKYLLERLGGTRIDSCLLSDNSQIIRSQISATYKSDVKGANAIFYVSDLEPFMFLYRNEFIQQTIDLYDITINSRLYDFKRYTQTITDGVSSFSESEYYPDAQVFAMTDMYRYDPYVWLDPIAYSSMAKTILDYLVKNAPLDKEFFQENFNQLQLELVALDAEFQQLNNLKKRPKVITMTPSFGIWQKSFGIEVYPIILSKFGVMPDEAQLKVIKEQLFFHSVRCVAYENGLDADILKLMEDLVKERYAKQFPLYNLSFLTAEQIAEGISYFDLMRENLESLKLIAELYE